MTEINIPKVLFICKKRSDKYGAAFGLFNSATFVSNALNKIGIESKAICVVDNNCIDREVTLYKPTHVIIEALWVVPEKFDILIPLHRKVKWNVRVHSKIPFIANEGIAMSWIFQYNELTQKYPNFSMSFNNKIALENVNDILKNDISSYLPNIYMPDDYGITKVNKHDKEFIDIGCFGAIRPLKNHLMQAISAIKFANKIKKKLRFHINGNRIEQNGEPVLRNLRNLMDNTAHQLIEHEWMVHEKFIEAISYMDIGMQVSLSETFNIVTADFVKTNVPIVVSDEIEWMPFHTKAKPGSSDSISKCLYVNWMASKIYLHKLNNWHLDNSNKEATNKWLLYLAG